MTALLYALKSVSRSRGRGLVGDFIRNGSTSSNAAPILTPAVSVTHATPRISPLKRSMTSLPRMYSSAATIPTSSLLSYKTLPNGIRVAAEETPGHFSALGIYINAGSRYERQNVLGEPGTSHFIDRMAFKSTKNRSTEGMTTQIGKLGANFMAASSRETIMYQASIFNQDLEQAMEVFADTVQHPLLTAAEVEETKPSVDWEIQTLKEKPESILPEWLHEEAYGRKTLGNPLICPSESLPFVTSNSIRDFMTSWYTPERIVIAGVGMDSEKLFDLSEQYFGDLQAPAKKQGFFRGGAFKGLNPLRPASNLHAADFSTTSKSLAKHLETAHLAVRPELAMETAIYTGGIKLVEDAKQDFTHVYVAFESMSVEDDDIYALSVLQTLLGGGGSFSAGGPGKGMYSRLYTNVLNQHHAVDQCAAFHHCYADSGLFGIAIAVEPSFAAYIATIISREIESVCSPTSRGGVSNAEIARAKNQLKSSLSMSLESRLVTAEDLGRQVLINNHKVSVEEMSAKIDQVDMYNLGRVARRVFMNSDEGLHAGSSRRGSGQATVVGTGKLENLGDIRGQLARKGIGKRS